MKESYAYVYKYRAEYKDYLQIYQRQKLTNYEDLANNKFG